MRIMFLSHLPENPKARERYAKIQGQLNGYASAGTQVELCFPDDYPTSGGNLVPGIRIDLLKSDSRPRSGSRREAGPNRTSLSIQEKMDQLWAQPFFPFPLWKI